MLASELASVAAAQPTPGPTGTVGGIGATADAADSLSGRKMAEAGKYPLRRAEAEGRRLKRPAADFTAISVEHFERAGAKTGVFYRLWVRVPAARILKPLWASCFRPEGLLSGSTPTSALGRSIGPMGDL